MKWNAVKERKECFLYVFEAPHWVRTIIICEGIVLDCKDLLNCSCTSRRGDLRLICHRFDEHVHLQFDFLSGLVASCNVQPNMRWFMQSHLTSTNIIHRLDPDSDSHFAFDSAFLRTNLNLNEIPEEILWFKALHYACAVTPNATN